MMNKDKVKKLLLWFIIPGVLLAFWLGMSLFFASNYSFSLLVYGYGKKNIENYKTSELLKGEKVVGKFESK